MLEENIWYLYQVNCDMGIEDLHGCWCKSKAINWHKQTAMNDEMALKYYQVFLLFFSFLFPWSFILSLLCCYCRSVWFFCVGCLLTSLLSLGLSWWWCCAACVRSGSSSWYPRWGRWCGRFSKDSRRFFWLVASVLAIVLSLVSKSTTF